jgi:hypothetical protein
LALAQFPWRLLSPGRLALLFSYLLLKLIESGLDYIENLSRAPRQLYRPVLVRDEHRPLAKPCLVQSLRQVMNRSCNPVHDVTVNSGPPLEFQFGWMRQEFQMVIRSEITNSVLYFGQAVH